MTEITRRDFLKETGASVLTLSLSKLSPKDIQAQELKVVYPYRDWEGLYKKKWTWDRVGRSTHDVNCWYQARCMYDIYVKEGIVWREEQSADYPQTNADVPDFNPRGCQKGVCFSHRMYDPNRLRYPLKRVGERGEGKWKRISWDEALTEIADKFIDVLTKEGPSTIWWDIGTQISFGPQGLGLLRTLYLTDSIMLDDNPEIGDDHQGAAVTTGKIFWESSGDDWFYANIILIWGGNPFYTHIPNSHFFLEAKYNGAKLISITPDYNPSSVHCDLWVPVNIGTDAALGLSMAQVIVEEKLYNEAFIKEQTDLPMLVRDDTKRFLRKKDLVEGGEDDVFYFLDKKSSKIVEAPKVTLNLDGMDPALEGEYEAETLQGKVKVRPVFEFLKARLQEYTPEKATKICGTHPDLIRQLAQDIAKAKAVTNISTSNITKYYHGIEMQRAQILVFALCGHFGKKGSGFNAFPTFWFPDSTDKLLRAPSLPIPEAIKEVDKFDEEMFGAPLREKGYSREMIIYEVYRALYEKKLFISSVLAYYLHGGLDQLNLKHKEWDPYLKRDIKDYIKESLEKGWMKIEPSLDKQPLILFEEGGNFLRRVRGYTKLRDVLLPKLQLLVTMDWRMSNTARNSDIILPISGFYEKNDFTWVMSIAPFCSVTTKVVEPLGECKPEWEVHCLLAKKIQERAKERNTLTFKDREGKERRLDKLYDDLTYGGNYTEKDEEKLLEDALKTSTNVKGVTWQELKKTGYTKFDNIGDYALGIGTATDIKPNETITHLTWHTDKKLIWPTLTRRMQFYIDHELFFELGEELPVHKDNPPVGGNYPLKMTGGHTRWSIHALWRDHAYMLRLQRGEPQIWINPQDAKARGIKDGDRVRVFNDIDSFEVITKVAPSLKPGQVVVYHAWEPYQFKNHKSHQSLIPSPINPVELAGGYYHLRPYFLQLTPGQSDRGTRVELVKV